jgi:hypothetical protein
VLPQAQLQLPELQALEPRKHEQLHQPVERQPAQLLQLVRHQVSHQWVAALLVEMLAQAVDSVIQPSLHVLPRTASRSQQVRVLIAPIQRWQQPCRLASQLLAAVLQAQALDLAEAHAPHPLLPLNQLIT